MARDDLLDDYDIFDLLEQLVNKSLVSVTYPAAGEARYGMLESIRQYSRDRLFESHEGAAVRDRHADYFAAFAEEAEPHLTQSTMLQWTDRIALELDNLRAVLTWTLVDLPELALRIAGNLLYHPAAYWLNPSEAQAWLEPAVENARGLLIDEERTVRTTDFIKALVGLGLWKGWQGNTDIVLPIYNEGIELARRIGEGRLLVYGIGLKYNQNPFNVPADGMRELEEAIAIGRENGFETELIAPVGTYAQALYAQGKPEEAMPYFQEALELAQKTNNPYMNAVIYVIHGIVAEMQGNLDEAKRYLVRATENQVALKNHTGRLSVQSRLAHMAGREGELDEAEMYYRESILGWQELGHLPAVAHQIECFSFMAIARSQYELAARLLGAAREARQQLNALSEDPKEIEELVGAMDRLAEAMGEKGRDKALAEGGLISLDDAVQIALE